MPRIPHEGLVPRGDRLLIQAFPKLAKRLENNVDGLDKADKELLVKLLPSAIERTLVDRAPTNDLPQSVEAAISQIVAVVKTTNFGLQNVSADEPAPRVDTRNTSLETGESADDVSEPELPNGSDTSQQETGNSLSRNELQASAGSSGELGSEQERPRNARVSSRSRLTGRAARKRSQPAPGESAGDRG